MKNFMMLFAVIISMVSVPSSSLNEHIKDFLNVYISQTPFSADPMEFDWVIHQYVFRSVFANLVTQHSSGKFTGIIADSWHSSDDYTTWIFKIRQNLRFSNGDLITPEIVVKSLTRCAYLMKLKKSKSGIIEHLVGLDDLTSAESNFAGIKWDDDKVIFSFTNPISHLLERLSFGIYSIAHPFSYDNKNGAWKSPKDVIASGPYHVNHWDDNGITLKLSESFLPDLGAKKKFSSIYISWDAERIKEKDILIQNSLKRK